MKKLLFEDAFKLKLDFFFFEMVSKLVLECCKIEIKLWDFMVYMDIEWMKYLEVLSSWLFFLRAKFCEH